MKKYFNPRSPNGLRHNVSCNYSTAAYLNPRSPNGLRQPVKIPENGEFTISIHAARMGCDLVVLLPPCTPPYFNPRSPNGLRRMPLLPPPVPADFNPRSPNGLRHYRNFTILQRNLFQSTQPEWAATAVAQIILK